MVFVPFVSFRGYSARTLSPALQGRGTCIAMPEPVRFAIVGDCFGRAAPSRAVSRHSLAMTIGAALCVLSVLAFYPFASFAPSAPAASFRSTPPRRYAPITAAFANSAFTPACRVANERIPFHVDPVWIITSAISGRIPHSATCAPINRAPSLS